jgi:hypothetical protein
MDILAHSFWTYAVYSFAERRRKRSWSRRELGIAVFFGIFPDLLAFGPVIFASIIRHGSNLVAYAETRFVNEWGTTLPRVAHWVGHGRLGGSIPPAIPSYVYSLYNISHSFVVFLFVFALVWIIRRRPYWLMAGWGLHIGIDIFSHSDKFFPTPVLYPFSRLHFHGVSWADPAFMLINYSLLLVTYLVLHYTSRTRKKRVY